MAKVTTPQFSEGELQTPRKNHHSSMRGSSNKSHKKPTKSNITNKVKSRQSGSAVIDDGQSDDENGDSSAIEEQQDTTEEPDAFALSGAQQSFDEAAKRLAGHEFGDQDMFENMSMTASSQAMAGATRDGYGSDDDDYADVENVSDSEVSGAEGDEDDERSILRSVEKDLIDEFERTEQRQNANIMMMDMNDMALDEDEALARRLSLQGTDGQTDEFGFAVNMNEDPFYGFSKNDNVYNDMWNEAESALWRMPQPARARESSDPASTTQKRVRFEEIHSRDSSRSDSEDPNESFPDIFAASDDPVVKQRIAFGLEQDDGFLQNDFADAESFYDFEDEDEKLAFEVDEESDSEDDLSSYDCR